MLPDSIIATIEEILAAPSDQAILDLIETKLNAEKQKRTGAKVTRAAGGTILILEQESRSPRAGPMCLALFVKIPEPSPRKKMLGIVTRDGRFHARGVSKALIIASLLDWYATVPERYLLGSIKMVFYSWHENALSALDQYAGKFPMVHVLAWFMEPTTMLACPLENGFGALSINFPASLASDPSNLEHVNELANAITDRFKPSHPSYPLDPSNYLSHRFLPGAEIARATMTRDREMKVTFTHRPLSDDFIQCLVEFIDAKSSELGIGEQFRVNTNYHYAGAKFNSNNVLFQQFCSIYKKTFDDKEPYLDWHVNPSIASCIYKHHPEAAGFVFGPGDPFFLNDDQEFIDKGDSTKFPKFLDVVGNELLFKV